jgi:hypothetical protein
MWWVTVLYILIFIIVAAAISSHCGSHGYNTYTSLIWAWLLTTFILGIFVVAISDQDILQEYTMAIGSIAGLFLLFIVIWAIVNIYGQNMVIHRELHDLKCLLQKH